MEILKNPEIWLSAFVGFLLAFLLLMIRLSALAATVKELHKAREIRTAEHEASLALLRDENQELRQSEIALLKKKSQLESQVESQAHRSADYQQLLDALSERLARPTATPASTPTLRPLTTGNKVVIPDERLTAIPSQSPARPAQATTSAPAPAAQAPISPSLVNPAPEHATGEKFEGFTAYDDFAGGNFARPDKPIFPPPGNPINPAQPERAAEAAARDLRRALGES